MFNIKKQINMKKIIILSIIITTVISAINAQNSYYYMHTLDGFGNDDFIANLHLRVNETKGIDFTADGKCRGFVTKKGEWGFMSPKYTGTTKAFYDYIKALSDMSMCVQGKLYTEAISIGNFSSPRASLIISQIDGKMKFQGYKDNGIMFDSNSGKIYLNDKVYFNQYAWTSLGPGRNNDPTINNTYDKWLRIGSTGGVGIWGASGVQNDENPQLKIEGTQVKCNVPLIVNPENNVEFAVGVAKADPNDAWIGTSSPNGLHIGTNNAGLFYMGIDQKIYIGLYDSEIKAIRKEIKDKFGLFVSKGVLSEDFAIAPKSSWADFVFQKNYALRPLSEVEKFIKDKKHLPDVPSAQKVADEGYSQHEINKALLQKVEELTLYVIELEKQVNALKAK